MRTFLVDRVIDSEQSEGAIVPTIHIQSQYDTTEDQYYVTTTVKSIELGTLVSGRIIAVIYVEPVDLNGTLITGIYEYVDFCPVLKADDCLRLYYSSKDEEGYRFLDDRHYEVCLKSNLAAFLTDNNGDSRFKAMSRPHKCPRCQSRLFRAEDDVLRCYNFSCPAMLAMNILNWRAWAARKDSLEFIDYRFVVQLIESGIVTSIIDLYRLRFEQLTEAFGLEKRQAKNVLLALEYSKQRSWIWLLERMCTRTVGYRVRNLAKKFSGFQEISQADITELQKTEYFYLSTAQSVYYWFKTSANQELVQQLQEVGFKTSDFPKVKDDEKLPQLINIIQRDFIKPITDNLSELWQKFQDKLQNDEEKFSDYGEKIEKIENQLNQYEKLLLEKFDQLLTREDLKRIVKDSFGWEKDPLVEQIGTLRVQYYDIQSDLTTIRSILQNSLQATHALLTVEDFQEHQTHEAKLQQSQFEKILDRQIEETYRRLQQFVASSIQQVTKESAKASDLKALPQLINKIPDKVETQLKLDSKLKSISEKLAKLTEELASCEASLQKQITNLATQTPGLETLRTEKDKLFQAINERFKDQEEALLNAIQTQQDKTLPRFKTLQQKLAEISRQNDRLNEQLTTEQNQSRLEQQRLQEQNDHLQAEIQQSLREQRTLAEKLSERSQLLEEANHQLPILVQSLSPVVHSAIERLNQFQPDNTSPEALNVFRQLAAQIHQANEQLQAIRPVAIPLINGLQQENAELRQQVQNTEQERDRLQESLNSTNTELSQAQLTSDRLNQEKLTLQYNLSDTQFQLRTVREQQASSQREVDRLAADLRQADKNLKRSEQERFELQTQLEALESKLQDREERLQHLQERVTFLEQQQNELSVQLAHEQGQLKEVRQSLTQAQQKVADLEESVQEQQKQIIEIQTLYNQAQTQIDQYQEKQRSLEEQLEITTNELKAAEEAKGCFISRMLSGRKK